MTRVHDSPKLLGISGKSVRKSNLKKLFFGVFKCRYVGVVDVAVGFPSFVSTRYFSDAVRTFFSV